MSPSWLQIILLALLQGAAELLPVSSSAHVILAEKLMGLNPSSPSLTFLLVMLHTGTMFAVIAYFWSAWQASFFSSTEKLKAALPPIVVATVATAILGFGLKTLIEKVFMGGGDKAEVEQLFSNLLLMSISLDAVGLLILAAGFYSLRHPGEREVEIGTSAGIGLVQGLCLPFRGFSRSGATISSAMLMGIGKRAAEEFSFALAVVLTPPLIAIELKRLLKENAAAVQPIHLTSLLAPGLVGMVASFGAGLLALKLLSSLLESGRWYVFGIYCLLFSAVVFGCWTMGY